MPLLSKGAAQALAASLAAADRKSMKCPHCLTTFYAQTQSTVVGEDKVSRWTLLARVCPACNKYILSLQESSGRFLSSISGAYEYQDTREFLCYPRGPARAPLGAEVPEQFASDYREACLVLPDSPKASAALSRRCLQHLLREQGQVKPGNLADEIQQVLDGGTLPLALRESLDSVRHIGNFAAHPIKSTSSGEIMDVEAGEADWTLSVLESLFDHYFTQPAILKRKREALNAKLKAAGKSPMK